MLIDSALPDLEARLRAHPMVLLQAPPGAGKSTIAPLALLDEDWLHGQRILMLEPRRLAARAVAARMAHLRGEALGQTVGYRVRFENRVSDHTRLEVLTEGILARRLQNDPALDGVGLVIFDEFHERSLHADLALALCRDAQAVLRPDLRLLIMSATLDGDAMSAALDGAPVVSVAGRQFPIELHYAERDSSAPLPVQVANAIVRVAGEQPGDILAFLPGAAEIQRAQAALAESRSDLLVCPLYGDLPLDAQQAAITPDPSGRRKVVLATSIAETSLTIEGVRAVVDSGYARVPRFDPRTGLTRLDTVRVTLDSADQRAGRAGRLGPGVCQRLWTAQTHRQLKPIRTPEILEADLASLRLEMAQWGARTADDLRWITPPPAGALAQATALLQLLGALDSDDGARITERGWQLLDWGAHPRLAHLLSEAEQAGAGDAALAADVAAVLEERDPLPREAGADVTLRVEALRRWRGAQRTTQGPGAPHRHSPISGQDARGLARIERLAAQWRKTLRAPVDNQPPDPYDVGRQIALAYPDRIAQRRGDGAGRYKLALGRGVTLLDKDPLQVSEWLAVAHVDGGQQAEGRVFLAAPLHPEDLEPFAAEREVVGWDARQGALIAQRERRVGELVLATRPLPQPPADQRMAVLCDVVRREGLSLLDWTDASRQWQARAQSVHVWRGEPWPDVSDAALLACVEEWLAPWLDGVTRRADFARLEVLAVLQGLLARPLRAQLESLAPERLTAPSGSNIRLQYALDGSPPVLAVRIQEMFGLQDTPAVNEGRNRVLVHLLSPAQRPIQVTQDLRSFWRTTYPEIRKELRGRYPKHAWPEDPLAAAPTRKTARAGR